MSLNNEILATLENNPKQQYNSKGIMDAIYGRKNRDLPPSELRKITAKIRTELKRLSDHKKIRRMHRGFYQAKPSPRIIQKLEDPETKLHGIKLECELTENNTFGIHGISAQNNILDFLKTNRFNEVTTRQGTFLKRWTKNIWWEERNITITIHEKGLVEIFCGASNNPLSFPGFCSLCDYLSGYMQPISPFKKRNVMMKQVGVNRDFEEERLEGVSCITLHKFLNDWARIYQKENGVRYEHHLKLNITLEDAFNSLSLLTQNPISNGFSKKPDERRDVA